MARAEEFYIFTQAKGIPYNRHLLEAGREGPFFKGPSLSVKAVRTVYIMSACGARGFVSFDFVLDGGGESQSLGNAATAENNEETSAALPWCFRWLQATCSRHRMQ